MPYNGGGVGGSNQGPRNPALADAVKERIKALARGGPGNKAPVPVDLVTASGSGLDPAHQRGGRRVPAGARRQGARHAGGQGTRARRRRTREGRTFGILGEPRVNVVAQPGARSPGVDESATRVRATRGDRSQVALYLRRSLTARDRRPPDPDQLLAQVKAQEAAARRGRLRIYFGASAGVGKTYAMLTAARALRNEGKDVVVGLLETHGRKETEALLRACRRPAARRCSSTRASG